jgi:alpha-D-ribose 1-methylphosphonate 5-triphosphate synthase subunit PhnG
MQVKTAQHREEKERWYFERATFEAALAALEDSMAQQARNMAGIEEKIVRYQADKDVYERERTVREEEVQAERNHLIDRIRTQA